MYVWIENGGWRELEVGWQGRLEDAVQVIAEGPVHRGGCWGVGMYVGYHF